MTTMPLAPLAGVQPPKKVLHLIDTGGPGGAETVLASIASGLSAASWQSKVLVPTADWLFATLQRLQVDVAVVPWGKTPDIGYLAQVVRHFRKFQPDVVHAHLLGSAVYGSMAAALTTHVPLVCTFHGRPDIDPRDRFLRLKGRILSTENTRVVYVSHNLRAYAEPLLGVPKHLGRVIHNGVAFRPVNPTGRERVECGADSSNTLIGAVGNLRPAKDYPNLLKAAALVVAARPDARFVIVGEGEGRLRDELLSLTESLGLRPFVRFLGFRSDVAELLAAFDVYVSSSSTEGLPLATIEALSMGKPVVVTRCGGLPEVVEPGRTGLMVEPSDPPGLARGILEILGNPQQAACMGKSGARDVRERFARERMCWDYTQLYASLVQHDDASPPRSA